jgi:hypothetical protein
MVALIVILHTSDMIVIISGAATGGQDNAKAFIVSDAAQNPAFSVR